MDRSDLQILADARVMDAEALLGAERWAGAYYLLGYAVECALKACAAKRFREFEIPEKSLVTTFYTHDLDRLLGISGLRTAHDNLIKDNPRFRAYWNTVREWTESSRYDHGITDTQARAMLAAVCDPEFGVLTWLKKLW